MTLRCPPHLSSWRRQEPPHGAAAEQPAAAALRRIILHAPGWAAGVQPLRTGHGPPHAWRPAPGHHRLPVQTVGQVVCSAGGGHVGGACLRKAQPLVQLVQAVQLAAQRRHAVPGPLVSTAVGQRQALASGMRGGGGGMGGEVAGEGGGGARRRHRHVSKVPLYPAAGCAAVQQPLEATWRQAARGPAGRGEWFVLLSATMRWILSGCSASMMPMQHFPASLLQQQQDVGPQVLQVLVG